MVMSVPSARQMAGNPVGPRAPFDHVPVGDVVGAQEVADGEGAGYTTTQVRAKAALVILRSARDTE